MKITVEGTLRHQAQGLKTRHRKLQMLDAMTPQELLQHIDNLKTMDEVKEMLKFIALKLIEK